MSILDVLTGRSGRNAQTAIERASELTAQGQTEALDYMREVEALPLELRNQYLPQYADIISGGAGQQQAIETAQASPLYNAIMGGQAVGEDAIMRNAAMTGGMRSGNVQGDLTDYGSQLSNNALLESYRQQMQGIQNLAYPTLNTNSIANATAAPNATIGQGIIAGNQARQDSDQALLNNIMGLGGAAIEKYSDIRLKTCIEKIGKNNGHNIYRWLWNNAAKKLGLTGQSVGVMAHEIAKSNPHCVGENSGYLTVNYQKLGVQ